MSASDNNAPGNAALGNGASDSVASGSVASGHTAVVLLNVGTPHSPSPWHVGAYLAQFLTDRRVVSLPWVLRQLLVRGLIVPLRAFRSAAKYRRVWTPEGSPLLVHSQNLQRALQQRLPHMRVLLAMRYGAPSIDQAVQALVQAPPARLLAVPMFPHFAEATTGTALAALSRCLARHALAPEVRAVPFGPHFHACLGQKLRRHAHSFGPQHVLFSYHGLPLKHVYAACAQGCSRRCRWGQTGESAGGVEEGAAAATPAPACYVHNCHASSRALAAYVPDLPFSTAFQSRMRGSAWTGPHTLEVAEALARKGVSRLLVACPSFACDCLETLEEIGAELAEAFLRAGGKAFAWVPALNDEAPWADALAQCLRAADSPVG